MAEKLAGGNVTLALLGNTLPTGAILVVLILALGPISGAHFNPAVSFTMALNGGADVARLRPLCCRANRWRLPWNHRRARHVRPVAVPDCRHGAHRFRAMVCRVRRHLGTAFDDLSRGAVPHRGDPLRCRPLPSRRLIGSQWCAPRFAETPCRRT